MWQREQKPSRSEPEPVVVCLVPPRSNVELQLSFANGFKLERLVPSGGAGMSQLPSVDVSRAIKRNAARQAGSRQAFAIIDPFHSSKMRVWHAPQTCGPAGPDITASYGGGWALASSVL